MCCREDGIMGWLVFEKPDISYIPSPGWLKNSSLHPIAVLVPIVAGNLASIEKHRSYLPFYETYRKGPRALSLTYIAKMYMA